MAEGGLQLNTSVRSDAVSLVENALDEQNKRVAHQTVYSKPEEWINRISHLVGVGLSVAAAALLIVKISLSGLGAGAIMGVSLFAFSLVMLFTMSTLYHFQPVGRRRSVFRKLDQCSISLLGAGTFAPFAFIATYSHSHVWAITLFAVVAGVALITLVLNLISISYFKVYSLIGYIIMAWAAVIRIDLMTSNLTAFILMLVGVAVYAIGVAFYQLKRIHYNHAIWHFFVLAGAAIHFVAVYFYLIP